MINNSHEINVSFYSPWIVSYQQNPLTCKDLGMEIAKEEQLIKS